MTINSILQVMLLVASGGLAAFCLVLARRLRRLNDLESGLGGAIAVMTAEVDRLDRAIRRARDETASASKALSEEIAQARREREMWDLRQKMDAGIMLGRNSRPSGMRRLRKKNAELADA